MTQKTLRRILPRGVHLRTVELFAVSVAISYGNYTESAGSEMVLVARATANLALFHWRRSPN